MRTPKAGTIPEAEPPKVEPTTSLQTSCRRTLQDWSAPNPAQDQLRQDYLDHLIERPDGWSRNCLGAHLTVSSLICAAGESQVLLTLHSRIGRWLQTGGHIESTDSTLEAAAVREAHEESGLVDLALAPSPLLLSRHEAPCGSVRPTYHLDVQYLVIAGRTVSPKIGDESIDVRWFAHDQLPAVDDSVVALVRAARARLGW
jgi:8-oxo-dGTP pyrophosphatase MutT (NUDIX family)